MKRLETVHEKVGGKRRDKETAKEENKEGKPEIKARISKKKKTHKKPVPKYEIWAFKLKGPG